MSKWYPCIYCTEDMHCMKFTDDECESFCVLGPCTNETPSNGDRIRRMTDEELDDWLSYICDAYYMPSSGWLDWLKRAVKE